MRTFLIPKTFLFLDVYHFTTEKAQFRIGNVLIYTLALCILSKKGHSILSKLWTTKSLWEERWRLLIFISKKRQRKLKLSFNIFVDAFIIFIYSSTKMLVYREEETDMMLYRVFRVFHSFGIRCYIGKI